MNLPGTQWSLRAGVIRVGFWKEVALVLNCPCYGRGSALHNPMEISPSPTPQARKAGLIFLR